MEILSRPDALNQLPDVNLQQIQVEAYCAIDEQYVESLIGKWGFTQATSKPRKSPYYLNDDGKLAVLCWETEEIKIRSDLASTSWKDIVGPVRDQKQHLLCWAYAASDLVSAQRILRQWENDYYPLCPHYLCRFVHPGWLGKDEKAKQGHRCYRCSIEDALKHIIKDGIPREISVNFLCSESPTHDRIPRGHGEVKSIRTLEDTLEAALKELPLQPIGADLIVFSGLWKSGENIYRGPKSKGSKFEGYHAVIIVGVKLIGNEVVAICKMSNILSIDLGYAYVSLSLRYMIVGGNDEMKRYVRPTLQPMPLLSNFIVPEMDNMAGSSHAGSTYKNQTGMEGSTYPLSSAPKDESSGSSANLGVDHVEHHKDVFKQEIDRFEDDEYNTGSKKCG
ncbi:unnamed protein product [Arabidopsis halleri]